MGQVTSSIVEHQITSRNSSIDTNTTFRDVLTTMYDVLYAWFRGR